MCLFNWKSKWVNWGLINFCIGSLIGGVEGGSGKIKVVWEVGGIGGVNNGVVGRCWV